MQIQNVAFQRTERAIGEDHFYPIHMSNEELQIIIYEIMDQGDFSNSEILKVFVRTDKGGKGIDIKIEGTRKRPNQIVKVRMFSVGLNATWKLVDFFDHYTQPASGITKVIAGKEYHYPKYVAQELMGFKSDEVDIIYKQRLKHPEPPIRNALFQQDNWTCIFEQNNYINNN